MCIIFIIITGFRNATISRLILLPEVAISPLTQELCHEELLQNHEEKPSVLWFGYVFSSFILLSSKDIVCVISIL